MTAIDEVVLDLAQQIDRFLSIAAHELKTPLTALIGYGQTLERRLERDLEADQRMRRTVSMIVSQSRRLSKLVETLLDLSRLQMGQFSLECTRVSSAEGQGSTFSVSLPLYCSAS